MIISIGENKSTWQNSTSIPDFLKNKLSKLGIQGKFSNKIMKIYDNFIANILCNGEKTEFFPQRIRNKMGMTAFIPSTQHYTMASSQYN